MSDVLPPLLVECAPRPPSGGWPGDLARTAVSLGVARPDDPTLAAAPLVVVSRDGLALTTTAVAMAPFTVTLPDHGQVRGRLVANDEALALVDLEGDAFTCLGVAPIAQTHLRAVLIDEHGVITVFPGLIDTPGAPLLDDAGRLAGLMTDEAVSIDGVADRLQLRFAANGGLAAGGPTNALVQHEPARRAQRRLLGLELAGVGATVSVTTLAVYALAPPRSEAGWTATASIEAAGWVLAASGGVVFLSGTF